ncbi:MAG TPA: YtxH domain-containing protein [Candidatus Angelobacter sp.]
MNEYQRYEDYSQQADEGGNKANVGRAITFLLIGMGVGAAAALLFTPMSGRELRGAIGNGCRRAVDGIAEQTRYLRERGSNLLGFNRRKA